MTQENIDDILGISSTKSENSNQPDAAILNIRKIQSAGKQLKNIVIVVVSSTLFALLLVFIAYNMVPGNIVDGDWVSYGKRIRNIYIIAGVVVFISNIIVLVFLYLAGDNLENSVIEKQ